MDGILLSILSVQRELEVSSRVPWNSPMPSSKKEKSPNLRTGDLVVSVFTVLYYSLRDSVAIEVPAMALSVSSIQLVEKRSPRQEPMLVPFTIASDPQ